MLQTKIGIPFDLFGSTENPSSVLKDLLHAFPSKFSMLLCLSCVVKITFWFHKDVIKFLSFFGSTKQHQIPFESRCDQSHSSSELLAMSRSQQLFVLLCSEKRESNL